MSNDETTPAGGVHATPPAKRRRALWVATGVAGLTGVVGLAALGGLAARNDKSDDANRLSDQHSATAKQNVSDAGRADEERGKENDGQDPGKQDDWDDAEWSGQDDWSGKDAWSGKDRGGRGERDEEGRVREVPCDDDALVEAVVRANNELGGTLKLARDCKYELSDHDRKNGSALPTIRQRITIKGDKSIIKRDSSNAFRIFTVGEGGELTLKGITLKDGNAAREKKKDQEPWPTPPKTDTSAVGEAARPGPAAAPVAAASTPETTPVAPVVPVAPGMPGESGGDTPDTYDEGADGGAILVKPGGSAFLEDSNLFNNNASGNGGAIANFGRT
ncbi:right-handed parallel beta-helix repeat-containing protein, partial [Micromonospora sp. NEAU-HG-1]|nr:right-handed parallel beta-helix repeat-containing protein [Micromonospora rubida]